MTPSQLRRAALEDLRVVAAGDPIAAEDDALMTRKYSGLLSILLRNRLADWGSTEDIPAYAELAMTQMLAYAAAASFGIEAGRMEQLRQMGAVNLPANQGGPSEAERTLRQMLARKPVRFPVRGTYY